MDTEHVRPMLSKKFLAFLVSELTWKVIIGIILVMGMRNGQVDFMVGTIILSCVLIVGFVEVGFIIGQASLDKYLGLAQIAAQNGSSIRLRGAEIDKPAATKAPPEPETKQED